MRCPSPFLGILGANKHGCGQQTIREFQASSIQSARSLPALQEEEKNSISQSSQRMMDDHVDGMGLFIRAWLNLNCVSTTPHQPSGQAKARLAARGRRGEAVGDSPSIKCGPLFFSLYFISMMAISNSKRENPFLLRKGGVSLYRLCDCFNGRRMPQM